MGKYPSSTSVNSAWLGEQAYSHQNRFKLIAQISQPPPRELKTPSSSVKDLLCC